MDQCWGVIWDAAIRLFSCTKAHAAYVYKQEENIDSLKRKRDELQRMETDVQTKIQNTERTEEMQRTNVVNGWLQDVRNLEKEMDDILDSQEVHNKKCLSGYCQKNYALSYKFGKRVIKMLNTVDDLLNKGKGFAYPDIAYKLPPKPVDEMPSIEIVGLDLMVDQVWNSVKDDNVGTIGLYGMGGVGKTALMKRIHNEFGKRKHNFDLVLWVVVSRDCDIDIVMNDIRNRLGIDDSDWNKSSRSLDKRAAMIYKLLKKTNFVLMLDDLWRELELEKVGVPIPKDTNNKSKVLFTTRYKDVCAKMKAEREFKVECLLEKEAFDLFCEKVGDKTLKCHTEIPNLAKEMAKECGGLPLALTTMGVAMAGVESVEAWRQTAKHLKSSPWTALNLEDRVFRILKFSYDKLPDETHKKCFRYHALYPKDYEVDIGDLIDRWIGEGFLCEEKGIYDMYEQGKSIIEKLKLSCLLEGVEYYPFRGFDHYPVWGFRIKMHNVIRDMALWLAHDQDGNKEKVVVEGKALAMSEMGSETESLNVVERISITNSEGNWQVPACPNLITLCVRLDRLITGFSNLQSMTRLKVLDLSDNGSTEQVPSEIGKLFNLEFLNLSKTDITRRLPIELKNLKNLRVFLMEDVRGSLEIIPLEVIESLQHLKVFRFTMDDVATASVYFKEEETFLKKLESLPKLKELCIQLTTITGIRELFGSSKLQGCSRHVRLSKVNGPLEMSSLLSYFSTMEHLEHISLSFVNNIMQGSSIIVIGTCPLGKLRQVEIECCDSITHLTWIKYAPLLESLHVFECGSIEEVVKESKDDDSGWSKDKADDNFQHLTHLKLVGLPKLKSIHKRALAFRLLKYILVSRCPNLKKLPLNSSSAAKDSLIAIQGQTEWWDNLEWEDANTTTEPQDNLITIQILTKWRDNLAWKDKTTTNEPQDNLIAIQGQMDNLELKDISYPPKIRPPPLPSKFRPPPLHSKFRPLRALL